MEPTQHMLAGIGCYGVFSGKRRHVEIHPLLRGLVPVNW